MIQCFCRHVFIKNHHHLLTPLSTVINQKRSESLERPGLSRAHSLRMHGISCGEEGLKRVCSAPQLGDQDKGSLLKRKLSVSDTEPCVVDSGNSKHKKQGQWPILLFKSLLLLISHQKLKAYNSSNGAYSLIAHFNIDGLGRHSPTLCCVYPTLILIQILNKNKQQTTNIMTYLVTYLCQGCLENEL